jgi:hypothetical protein
MCLVQLPELQSFVHPSVDARASLFTQSFNHSSQCRADGPTEMRHLKIVRDAFKRAIVECEDEMAA